MKFGICVIEEQNSKSETGSVIVSQSVTFHLISARVALSNQSHLPPIHLQSAIVFRSQVHTCWLPGCLLHCARRSSVLLFCLTGPGLSPEPQTPGQLTVLNYHHH